MNITLNKTNNNINQLTVDRSQPKFYANGSQNVSFKSAVRVNIAKILDGSIDSLIEENSLNIVNKIKFNKLLQGLLPHVVKPENYINCGKDSKVYRISDRYVAKITRGVYGNDAVRKFDMPVILSKKFSELDAYYGQPVIRMGDVDILKNATPYGDNVLCGAKFTGPGAISKADLLRYKNEVLPTCAALPQESYDNLAINLKKMNKMSTLKLTGMKYYTPDIANPNNFLISDNKIKIVDELEEVPVKNPNSVFTMLEPLLIRLTPFHEADFIKELVDTRREIYRKCLISGEKIGLPLESDMKLEYAEWVLDSITRTSNIVAHLGEMRKAKAPLRERIGYINNELLDKFEQK